MTISTVTNRAQWSGNGAATVFSFSFEIESASQAYLYLTSGGTTTLIASNLYTLSGLGSETGGTVTYPLTGSPIASGSTLTLVRVVALQQLTDLVNQSNYFPNQVEEEFDYLMMALQQIALQAQFSIQAPVFDSSPSMTLPAAAARASMVLAFDANGNVSLVPLSSNVGAGNMIAELGSNGLPGFKAGTDFVAGTTTFLNLSRSYGSVANVFVAFDGVYQERDSYVIAGARVIFGSWSGATFTPAAIPVGVNNVDVIGGSTVALNIPAAQSVGPTQLMYTISGTTAQRPIGAPDGWQYLDTSLSTYGTPIMKSHLSSTGWV